jgi:5'-deoxy-5'-methylthioadenosine phosphorylase
MSRQPPAASRQARVARRQTPGHRAHKARTNQTLASPLLGIIGGSGFTELTGFEGRRRLAVRTPYGSPSAPLTFGRIGGRNVVFLARHGNRHTLLPHEVNYRANIWALHARKVKDVVAVAWVGGIRADLAAGTLAIPGQILDYTHGRESTFHGAGRGVTHIDFTHPFCEALRRRLLEAARKAATPVVAGGTYATTQGPRLETAAEIDRLERDGADMVGMTLMPEAALARELGLCYAAIAVVVNDAAGRRGSAGEVRLDADRALQAMARVRRIFDELVALDGG